MAFDIQTTVEVEAGIITEDQNFTPSNQSGTVTVIGSLSGAPGREIEFVANEASANGYQFKKWIIETIPVTKVEIATSMPFTTYDEICTPSSQNTEVSTSYFSDGQFLYEDQEGNRLAPNGFYGIGGGRYYIHNTATGLQGPLTCVQSNNTGGTPTGGGGISNAQPTGDEQGTDFGGRPGGGGVGIDQERPTNTI